MMARTRVSDTAMAYIQHPIAIASIAQSMIAAIFGDAVTDTDAP